MVNDASEQYRAARRAAVRAHHPDAGGDADSLQKALAAVELQFDRRVTATIVTGMTKKPLRRKVWTGVRSAFKRLPHRRRYIDL